MAYDVFPRHNLPFESEEWARKITDTVRENSYSTTYLSQDVLSNNRSSAGQLGAFSRSVREIQTQSARIIDVPDVLVNVTSPNLENPRWSDTSVTVDIPPPLDGSFRPPIVQLFGQVYGSQKEFHYDWVFVGAFGLSALGTSMSLGGGRPPYWQDDIVLLKTLPPGTSSVTVQLRGALINPGSTSITETLGLVNARLSVMYGGV